MKYEFDRIQLERCMNMDVAEKGTADKSRHYQLHLSARTSCSSSISFDRLTMADLVLLCDTLTDFIRSEIQEGGTI